MAKKARVSPLFNPDSLDYLKRFEQSQNETDIADEVGKSRGTIKDHLKKYRDAGVLTGSYSTTGDVVKVNWDELDKMRRSGHTQATIETQEDKLVDSTPNIPPTPKSTPAMTLSALELTTLQIMAQERIKRSKGGDMRSGRPQDTPTSVRLDSGLWEALTAYAEAEGIKRTEAMNRAIEALLGR